MSQAISRSQGNRPEDLKLMSRWQNHLDQHNHMRRYRDEMAEYHQQKARYYAAMAKATPWGFWYKMKAAHHARIVRDHQKQSMLHQAKLLKYEAKINKNALAKTRESKYHRSSAWYHGSMGVIPRR
jgi:hypothetical protein